MIKKFCCVFAIILIILAGFAAIAHGEDYLVNFVVNGNNLNASSVSFIRNGVTYVDLRALSSTLSLTYTSYEGHDSAVINNYSKSICFVPDEHATVSDLTGNSDSEYSYRVLAGPCLTDGVNILVAARDIADEFGYALSYDAATSTVYFGYIPGTNTGSNKDAALSKVYYFQNQAEFNFPSHGSGYCWVCSYAMVMTNLTGTRITPADVAAVNLKHTSDGAYCYHGSIVSAFNLKFVPALPTTSPYYGGMSGVASGTYINNPTKDRAVTIAALKEAIDYHPEGVLVRYGSFPHTMVAVGYEGDTILFNDPAPTSSSSYATVGRYHCVPFEKTCVPSRGYDLEDLSFIQAIGY